MNLRSISRLTRAVANNCNHKCSKLIPADRQDEEERILAKIGVGESAEHTETLRQTKDGRLIHVSVTASPIKDATGKVIGVSKVARDITGRKLAEDELRESNQRFRGTFENAAVGIAHVDPAGAWLRVNERICQIVGYGREELLTKTFQEITHAGDLDADVSQLKGLLAGETDSYTMEKRYLRKDGSLIWGNLTVSCSRNAEGKVEYLIAVVDDISRRKQGETELRESDERFRVLFDSAPMAAFSCDRNAVPGVDRHWGSLKLWTMDGMELPLSQSPIAEVLRTGIARAHDGGGLGTRPGTAPGGAGRHDDDSSEHRNGDQADRRSARRQPHRQREAGTAH